MAILIAEDNEAQRRYLKELLSGRFPDHMPLIEANDGESAVRMAIEARPVLSIWSTAGSPFTKKYGERDLSVDSCE